MRKILGGLLSLVALLFLSLAYVELARAEDPECEKALAAKIVELVKSDKSDILKLQLRLTTLKLAAETMGGKNKTIEAYVRKQAEVLNSLDTDEVRSALTVLYEQNGAKQTEKAIADLEDATAAKLKGGKYLTSKGKYRFNNKDLAAYTAAHRMVNGDESIYNTSDSAILWFQSEISEGVKKKVVKGSIAANYVEVSTQIAKLTGVMKGIQAKTLDEVEAEVVTTEAAIQAEFVRIAKEFKSDFSESCAKLASCPTCEGAAEIRESSTITAIAQITDEIQADTKVKDAKVAQAIAHMKKEGITVDLIAGETKKEVAPKVAKVKVAQKPPVAQKAKQAEVKKNKAEDQAKANELKKKIHEKFAKGEDKKFLEELKKSTAARKEIVPKKQKLNGATTETSVETKPETKPAVESRKVAASKPVVEVKKVETKPVTEAKPVVETKKVPEAKPLAEENPTAETPIASEAPTTNVLQIRALGGDLASLNRGVDPTVMALGATEEVGKFNIGDCTVTIILERLPVGFVNRLNIYNPYKNAAERTVKKEMTTLDSTPSSQTVLSVGSRAVAVPDIYSAIGKHCATSTKK